MSRPKQTTILLDANIPWDVDKGDLVGIDTQFASSGALLRGFKLIPSGVHLFHYSRNDIRYGTWFECTDGDIYFARWVQEDEEVKFVNLKTEPLNLSKSLDTIGETYGMMMEYPESSRTWSQLTGYMDSEILQIFLPGSLEVSTSTSSFEETMVLNEALNAGDKNVHTERNDYIKYTVVQFKKNRSDGINNITQDYLDKTWYLEELYGDDTDLVLAELQLAFVNFIVLANFCSGYQWVQLIKLVLMSPKWIGRRLSWFVKFLQLLAAQLEKLPPEFLVGPDSIINTETYIEAMENIVQDIVPSLDASCCGRMKMKGSILEAWNQVLSINQKRFTLDLNQLKGQFNDEDAPQVV